MYESVEKLARQAYMGVRAMVELTAEQHAIMARGFAEEGKEGFYPDSLHWMPDAARDLAVNPQLAGQWRLK
jgi:hypothetical protein